MRCSPLCSIEKIALRTQTCDHEQVIQRLELLRTFKNRWLGFSSCLTLLPQSRIRFACRCKRMRILAQINLITREKITQNLPLYSFCNWKLGGFKQNQNVGVMHWLGCIQLLRSWGHGLGFHRSDGLGFDRIWFQKDKSQYQVQWGALKTQLQAYTVPEEWSLGICGSDLSFPCCCLQLQ